MKFPTLSKAELYVCELCGKKLTVEKVQWHERRPYCAKCKAKITN